MNRAPVVRHMLCASALVAVAAHASLPAHAAAASTPVTRLPAGALATVNGIAIPAAQLDDAVRASSQPDTPQLRQKLKQQLIIRELLRENAEAAHYDAKPEARKAARMAQTNAAIQLYLKDNVHPETVTDAQVKARYDAIVASLGKEEYKPRVITVPDAATAATVLTALKAGQTFDALARQYSTAPSKAAGGELPWVSFRTPLEEGNTAGLPLSIAQAVTQLSVGGVTLESTPVGEGVNAARVIVKLDAKRPTQVPSFDQLKDTIRNLLQALAVEKAAAQLSASLLKRATIKQ